MVFFEHFRGLNEAVKELVLLSLVTANQAESAAEKVGYRKPEEAYLCGMLRNVGEILIASYFPEQLQQIRAEVSDQGAAITQACRSVLGFTYDELGVTMVGRWNMPAEVGAAMTSEAEGRASDAPIVVTLAQLAHALTGAIYRSPAAVESRTRVALVLQKFGSGLGISSEGLEKIAAKAAAEARDTLSQCKVAPKDLTILAESHAAKAFGKAGDSGKAEDSGTTARVPNAATGPRTVAQLEREIDDMVRDTSGPADLQVVLLKILEAIQRGGGFDRVLFALLSPDRECVQGRIAIGDGSDELKAKFTIPLGFAGGPIGIALARQQEVSLRADWELQPTEVVQLTQLGARMLCVLPLLASGQLIGCLYYDQVESANGYTPAVDAALHRLRDRTVQVLRRK
jgi:eukaryotic-like serine/threonine-protein kinase